MKRSSEEWFGQANHEDRSKWRFSERLPFFAALKAASRPQGVRASLALENRATGNGDTKWQGMPVGVKNPATISSHPAGAGLYAGGRPRE